jgi:hypothetical protein
MYIFKKHKNKYLKGAILKIFLKIESSNYYEITDLFIFEDKTLSCANCQFDLNTLRKALETGRLSVQLPSTKKLFIPYTGYVKIEPSEYPSFNIDEYISKIKSIFKTLNEPHKDSIQATCIEHFREYLIENNESNLKKLKKAFNSLPNKEVVLLEASLEKDPLYDLMKTGRAFSIDERRYFLNDYFEDEWIEIK